MNQRLVIFGATGDLTSRKLMPALAQLHEAGQLPSDLKVIGLSRHDWDLETFRQHIQKGLDQHAQNLRPASRQAILSRLEYHHADVSDSRQVAEALGRSREPIVAYLALPPFVFAPAIEALASLGLPENSRIVVEKPFGDSVASAQALNQLLHRSFPEEAVFRIDHFLHMQTVQNILGLRFANRVFELMWNRDQIERVEIIWDETLTLEGRAGYYDRAGALKDMIQNHLLQLLCLAGMEVPLTLHERDLRDRKMDVLRAVRRLSAEEVKRSTIRGRYSAGRIGKREVPAYVKEEGIDPALNTETFAQVTLWIDNWRWSGIPFMLRSGKALGQDRREIAIYFRPVPHLAFEASPPPPNVLRLQLDPDRLAFGLNINGPGNPFDLQHIELDAELSSQDLPAYGRLLLSVFEGDCTLSIRADEAEEAWRIVEPILDVWASNEVPLREYPAGSVEVE